jgi:hypothetical protein
MLASSVAHQDADVGPAAVSPQAAIMLDLTLARCAAEGGATNAEIARDLTPYFSHRQSPSEFRETMGAAREAIAAAAYADETRSRLTLTDAGLDRVKAWLGTRDLPGDWAEVRDTHLTARALGQPDMPATRRKLLSRPDGLRMAIVQKAYDLRLRRVPTPARVRAALAGVALKRSFANASGPEFDVNGGVDANASRLLAGQLARRPQDFGTDTRLIAALAAEAIGAVQTDVATLRLLLIRQLVSDAFGAGPGAPASETAAPTQATSNAPDLETFVAAVKTAAEGSASGWPGNRKAFISTVWSTLRSERPDWSMDETDFKTRLVEAHRAGLIVLANADLKSAEDRDQVQRSATTYKNTVWHLIRLEG